MLNSDSPLPLYYQLKEALLQEIRGGQYHPHTPIPTERELSLRYHVSRTTVRQSLEDLQREGVLYRKQGLGTFVAPAPIVQPLNSLKGHVEELHARGYHPQVQLLGYATGAAPDDVQQALRLPAGETVVSVRRLICLDGTPLLLLDLVIPARLGVAGSPADLVDRPFTAWLQDKGLAPAHGEQRVAAVACAAAEARILAMEPGAPALQVLRTQWTADGQPLSWSCALYPGHRYQYIIRLDRN